MAEKRNRIDELLPDRSHEVQDILGHVPNWIVRWGISLVAAIIGLFLLAAWLFRYPDLISAPVIVSGENPPAPVISRSDGRLQRLLVDDGRDVPAGEILVLLENPADCNDVLQLLERLKPLPADLSRSPEMLRELELPPRMSLGAIQSAYEEFRGSVQEYKEFLALAYYPKKQNALSEQRIRYAAIVANLEKQLTLLDEEFSLMKKQHDRDEALLSSGIITAQDMENVKSQLLQKEYALHSGRTGLDQARLQMAQIDGELLDLSLQERERKEQLLRQVQLAQRTLSGQLSQWDQSYALRAPLAGKVSLSRYWSSSQHVVAGETVLTVVPPGALKLVGKAELPVDGAGKVKPGQRVNLRFSDFPYIEFGTVPGIVLRKSLISIDGKYTVDIALPEGLRTNYGKELPFNQELSGQAEIITDDIRLLTRLFNPLRSILKRNLSN